jgi:catechol 2,3-dioxygenase-like lactoylglutathione lyase family enzyme
MPKIRHIAIRSADCEATAAFFVNALGMELVQRRDYGPIDLSDGDINITLLPTVMGGREYAPGFEHIGFGVEDQDATTARLLEAGAKELNPILLGGAYFEAKFQSPEGLVVDVGHWRGASPIAPVAEATAG